MSVPSGFVPSELKQSENPSRRWFRPISELKLRSEHPGLGSGPVSGNPRGQKWGEPGSFAQGHALHSIRNLRLGLKLVS